MTCRVDGCHNKTKKADDYCKECADLMFHNQDEMRADYPSELVNEQEEV